MAQAPETVELCGLPFARIAESELRDQIERLGDLGGSRWIVTANIQHVGLATRDAGFRDVVLDADLVTADGMPICWLASWVGDPLPGRVTGADLIIPTAQLCADRGWGLFLLGGEPGIAEEAAQKLEGLCPGLAIAGTLTPPLQSTEDLLSEEGSRSIIAAIRAGKPHVLLAALGTPKQELWIQKFRNELAVPVSIGIGASFDFLVGRQQRAPEWVQRIGAEWIYRTLASPGRLGPRYARNGITFLRVIAAEFSRRRR